jgi:tetraacyldisaccharide 4'-kinase
VQHPEVNLLVCDDGLQHLRLARNVELVVFDERGVGNGHLLPAGPLREPAALPADPHISRHILYNAPQPSTAEPGICLTRALGGAVDLAGWWAGEPASMAALTALAQPQPGVPVLICAGLGHPGRFAAMLAEHGVAARVLDLPDHHDYADLPWPETPCEVLVTEKDAVKLDPGRVAAERPQSRVWVVPLELELPAAWLADLQAALG